MFTVEKSSSISLFSFEVLSSSFVSFSFKFFPKIEVNNSSGDIIFYLNTLLKLKKYNLNFTCSNFINYYRMNLNEFFHYKSLICIRKEKHDLDTCYFFHNTNSDFRRHIIDFSYLQLREREGNDITCLTIDKKCFPFYSAKIGFEDELMNTLLFDTPVCKNSFEHKFHIVNYKKSPCFFEERNIKCLFSVFCPYLHKNNLSDEMLENDENFSLFKDFYLSLLDNTFSTVNLEDVEQIFIKILTQENNFIEKGRINQSSFLEKSLSLSRIKSTQKQFQNGLNKDIYAHLKNIPTLIKGQLFYKVINTDNHMIYVSNGLPKKEDINKFIIAFLNTHNGMLIYGVDSNTDKLIGVKMDRKSRDKFKNTFNGDYRDFLIEYDGCIKYKFYDLEDSIKTPNQCIIVIKIKKIKKDIITLFDQYNKSFMVKEKFYKKFAEAKSKERIKISDIKQLDMKEFIEISKAKLEKYYKHKYKCN
jgi:hypothetical protein